MILQQLFCVRFRLLQQSLAVIFSMGLVACATPSQHLAQLAQKNGFQRSSIQAEGFELLVYVNADTPNNSSVTSGNDSVLHVYLEGDGSPWRYRTIVMPDPTPRRPLMLTLMALDSQPAAYLGRPCYNGTFAQERCNSSLWTSGRYSNTVIASMASGVRVLARRHKAREVWLFGHSGGGALAMLLADFVPNVTRIITVAGNLDTDAWTRHHGYTPLYSSLNPARQPDIDQGIWQWHLLGERDGVIPPQLVRPFIMRQPAATGVLFAGYTHGCCWSQIWPEVLQALRSDNPAYLAGDQFKQRVDQGSESGVQ